MNLPKHKTKIVCTIGPASSSLDVMSRLLESGMNIARLNFSHGNPASHAEIIARLRAVSGQTGKPLAIMADLPGPKIRLGLIDPDPIQLETGDNFTLTVEECVGNAQRAPVSFDPLPKVVKPGDTLFLNDGVIQLEVRKVIHSDVICRVVAGGELRSKKGLNLPGIELGIGAFTRQDHEWLRFAAQQAIDAVSQSFVDSAADMDAVRKAAAELNYQPFLIAKIERSRALDHLEGIMRAADGIMVARGDLGVEVPIERIPLLQKEIIREANFLGKPVITATQMMESMTEHSRPTRAEATDVANAILDGTDAVMLSGESAMGHYPVETVQMLARIAQAVESHRPEGSIREMLRGIASGAEVQVSDLLSLSLEMAILRLHPCCVIVPTASGETARKLNRLKLPTWVLAVCTNAGVSNGLLFSYGIFSVTVPEQPAEWNAFSRDLVQKLDLPGRRVILMQGPSPAHPEVNFKMEVIDL
jgi:pyruvate kinase